MYHVDSFGDFQTDFNDQLVQWSSQNAITATVQPADYLGTTFGPLERVDFTVDPTTGLVHYAGTTPVPTLPIPVGPPTPTVRGAPNWVGQPQPGRDPARNLTMPTWVGQPSPGQDPARGGAVAGPSSTREAGRVTLQVVQTAIDRVKSGRQWRDMVTSHTEEQLRAEMLNWAESAGYKSIAVLPTEHLLLLWVIVMAYLDGPAYQAQRDEIFRELRHNLSWYMNSSPAWMIYNLFQEGLIQ